ncbi:MAG TPA: hypothetical protein VM032_17475 [Vicinamibacterales bacterium]|nr:hypothetical protein [Vicinamibacterales bacterium]
MRSTAALLLLAVVLFAAGTVSLAESRHSRRLAGARERLVTLDYTDEGDLADDATLMDRLPPPLGVEPGAAARHAATVSYWLARYTSLTELTNAGNGPAPADAQLLLLAANAAFRTSAPQSRDAKGAVARLDAVAQAYADVLRKAPDLSDAAFNYELVVRLRDEVAKGPQRRARDVKPAYVPPDFSVDLPIGPTIHGRPGGPPEGESMSDFKTVTPMRYDEREEQMDPGRGQKLRRKG